MGNAASIICNLYIKKNTLIDLKWREKLNYILQNQPNHLIPLQFITRKMIKKNTSCKRGHLYKPLWRIFQITHVKFD